MSRPLRIDPRAASTDPTLPAFLAAPEDAPVDHGFPLVEATRTDGWVYGAITDYEDPDGCASGDGFVVAPDGSRAGLAWEVGDAPLAEVLPADARRWGVYSVTFPRPLRTREDLVEAFRSVLPALRAVHARVVSGTR